MSTPQSVSRSVLIVDDDEQLLRLMARLLEGAGHRVRTATGLAEVRALVAEAGLELDLVLLDVQLAAGESGVDLLPELDASHPGLAILWMSGDALPESLEALLSARGGRFLRKPFAPKSLLALVAEPGLTGDASRAGAETR